MGKRFRDVAAHPWVVSVIGRPYLRNQFCQLLLSFFLLPLSIFF